MTLEQAVELVLQADPWTTCDRCAGLGRLHQQDCLKCEGAGQVCHADYVEAYHFLGRDVPIHPKTFWSRVLERIDLKSSLMEAIGSLESDDP